MISKFDLRGAIIPTLTNIFSIRHITSDIATYQFIIRSMVSDVRSYILNIRQAISPTITNKFNIREILRALPSYTLSSFTSASYTLTVGTIPQITSRFDILSSLAGNTIKSLFNIRQAIIPTVTNKFDIRHIISPTLTNRFDIRCNI